MLKRAPVAYSPQLGFYVNLPTYTMIPGTWRPITPGKIHKDGADPKAKPDEVLQLQASVLVELPDYTPLDETGQIDKVAICQMYNTHPYYGKTQFKAPALVELDQADLTPAQDPGILDKLRAWLNR